jgi:hypothetical protein
VRLVVRWGRADLMRELLGKMYAREDLAAAVAVAATTAAAAGGLRMPPQRGRPAAAEAVAEAVQCALQCALEQRRVAIVALLLSHRASLSQVNFTSKSRMLIIFLQYFFYFEKIVSPKVLF